MRMYAALLAVMATLPASPASRTAGRIANGRLVLANSAVKGEWEIASGRFYARTFTDKLNGSIIRLAPDAFTITVAEGAPLKSSNLTIEGQPQLVELKAEPTSPRVAEREGGEELQVRLADESTGLEILWHGILRDGSNYLRQEIELHAAKGDVHATSIRLVETDLPGAAVAGTVKGSPIVAGRDFFAFEHPLADSKVANGRAVSEMFRELPLRAGQTVRYSSVIGATRPGQLRRDFLAYIERERAHPYRTFLHYNTWYDLGFFSRYDEASALKTIDALGEELVRKRGVTLDSFMFDDGWDNTNTLWQFNAGFPDGFRKVKEELAKFGSAPGVWLSPWGGYGKPREQRLAIGKAQGYEENQGGFALSGPKYYQLFHDTCMRMIREYGINQFKIDGTGNTDYAVKGSAFDSDFAAAIALIEDMRKANPNIFVNLTTGTYPSPFWLDYSDSIWRGGDDHDFAGVGSWRQKWITYRDADLYNGVHLAGPLYPLNSVMLHGIIYAKSARHLNTDPEHDFPSEVHDYFGTGTGVQELYITPALFSSEDWDTLAEAAKWSRENADVLKDVHWIGGDPALLEVYGWAAWAPRKAIVTLRNPDDHVQRFTLHPAQDFELPPDAARKWRFTSRWKQAPEPAFELSASGAREITLQAFRSAYAGSRAPVIPFLKRESQLQIDSPLIACGGFGAIPAGDARRLQKIGRRDRPIRRV